MNGSRSAHPRGEFPWLSFEVSADLARISSPMKQNGTARGTYQLYMLLNMWQYESKQIHATKLIQIIHDFLQTFHSTSKELPEGMETLLVKELRAAFQATLVAMSLYLSRNSIAGELPYALQAKLFIPV